MADAEEIQYNNDCLVITINIVDCPMAEIPLTEVFNVTTMSLLDNYHDVIRDTVLTTRRYYLAVRGPSADPN